MKESWITPIITTNNHSGNPQYNVSPYNAALKNTAQIPHVKLKIFEIEYFDQLNIWHLTD